MDGQKFEIAGKIENTGKKGSNRSIAGRYFLFVLTVLVVSGVWFFPFLQDAFPTLKNLSGDGALTDTTELNALYTPTLNTDSLVAANDSLQKANAKLLEISTDYSGIYYEVQIGAFKNFDIEKYQSGLVALHAERTVDGIDKLTLGKFRDLKVAKDFLADVREMGFKDAWIVAKEDGIRIPFDSEAAN